MGRSLEVRPSLPACCTLAQSHFWAPGRLSPQLGKLTADLAAPATASCSQLQPAATRDLRPCRCPAPPLRRDRHSRLRPRPALCARAAQSSQDRRVEKPEVSHCSQLALRSSGSGRLPQVCSAVVSESGGAGQVRGSQVSLHGPARRRLDRGGEDLAW